MSWTTCTHGHRHWGRRGAAGLLVACSREVLLQLRAGWVHRGGTWALPGGARERGEDAVAAALREAHEELGLPDGAVEVRGTSVATCGGWSYETVLAVPRRPLVIQSNEEAEEHRWVPLDEVDLLPLHPAFRTAWSGEDSALRSFVAGS